MGDGSGAAATWETAEAMERRWWGDRDAAMADRVLAAPDVPGGRLVVAGSLHIRLEPLPVGEPRAATLASRWAPRSHVGGLGCARSSASTEPVTSTTWACAAASKTCADSIWMGLG